MKRIILTLMLVVALTCLLAIATSAATTNEFGDVEIIPGMSEKSVFGDDGRESTFTTRIVLFDGAEYHTYPSYYVFTNNENTTYNFSQLNEKTGKSYGKKSAIRVEVPHNVKKVTGDIFNSYNDLKYVLFPDTLTEISGNMFYTSHGLEWVNVPRDCAYIRAYAFYGCSALKTIDMSNAKSLKETEANQFFNCPNLEELIFPEGFERFGGGGGGGSNYQNGLGSLKKLYLPDSVTYMGTIAEMKSIGTFVVPQGVTTLKSNQFSYCTGLKTIVVHKGVTSAPSNIFDMTFYIENIVYTGENLDEDNAVVTALKSYSRGDGKKPTFIYGNHCEYYYGNEHLNDTNPCIINCTRCNTFGVAKENPVHREALSIVYSNGYDNVGSKTVTCSNEGCLYELNTDASALLVCLGYSAPEDARGGIAVSYSANYNAIKEYETATGNALKYGVFAIAQVKLGDSDIFDENGDAINGAINAEITGEKVVSFTLRIIGFTVEYYDTKLAMGAYVAEINDEDITYSYIQAGTPKAQDKYCFISYNEVLNGSK